MITITAETLSAVGKVLAKAAAKGLAVAATEVTTYLVVKRALNEVLDERDILVSFMQPSVGDVEQLSQLFSFGQ